MDPRAKPKPAKSPSEIFVPESAVPSEPNEMFGRIFRRFGLQINDQAKNTNYESDQRDTSLNHRCDSEKA
jgi:hypothetical protein